MLYVTTRNSKDVFTAHRALLEKRGPDGGFYRPFHSPVFTSADIAALAEKPFNQCVADILNMLFSTNLTGWDVDFTVGRYPVRLTNLHHRIHLAESWHNPEWNYTRMERCLAERLGADSEELSDWLRIGIRIAVLFGIYGELLRRGKIFADSKIDIAAVSGDFTAPLSAWYARAWGLPVGNIVCCCNENNEIWNLFCHGQLRTDIVNIPTVTPLADITLPEDLERLIYECGGEQETARYLDVCRQGRMYCPDDAVLSKLREGLYVSVVSSWRIKDTIPSVYGTHSYIMSSYTALAYAGLQDYRVKKRESRTAVILSEISPAWDVKAVSDALGISEKDITNFL